VTSAASLQLIAMAIGPALFLLHRAYVADLREPEPVPHVFWYAAAGGIGASLLAVMMESAIRGAVGPTPFTIPVQTAWGFVVAMFVGVALVEELMKLAFVAVLGVADREIDEPFDWLVYAVAVGLGFATFENLVYVLQRGESVAMIRAVTAVPVHALCATTMGWWLAQASLTSCRNPQRAWLLALLEPTLWHGAYDTLVGFAATAHAPVGVLLAFVSVQWTVNARRVGLLQAVTAHARPVPPIRYPLQFAVRGWSRRRRHEAAREDIRLHPEPACCVCHTPMRRFLGFSEDTTNVRCTAAVLLPAHAACAGTLPRCPAHGQLYLGPRCPRCRTRHTAHGEAH
jgi:protease PrsW